MRVLYLFLIYLIISLVVPGGISADFAEDTAFNPIAFSEVWGYLLRGYENRLKGDEPLTDICYFSVGVNYRGRLSTPVAPPSLKTKKDARVRVHLVVADLSSTALMHFCLNPSYGVRDRLVGEIVDASKGYQGVQIDFESVAGDDAAAFLGFLKELKKRLPRDMILSVALPARRKNIGDAYSYREISAVADRIMIMAYDQHWSGSVPGPVASLSWCRDVLDYASKAVPREKLIMGLPLYGRSWQDRSYTRALIPSHVDEIIKNENAVTEYSIDRGASLSYEKTVRVKIYYEDTRSIVEKLSLYSSAVRSVAFWRLGMENGDLWSKLSVR